MRQVITKKVICTVILLLLIPACATADQYVGGIPLETTADGIVSGGVYLDSFLGTSMEHDVTKDFSLPDYTEIKWARLYVGVYDGHMQNNYEGRATVKFNGGSGTETLGVEELRVPYSFPIDGGSGPVTVNGHCNRVTSDYLMWYDVTDKIRSKQVTADVKTEQPDGYSGNFDGRIKIVTLVVAYDDGDGDQVYYWINQGHDTHSYYVEENLGETYEGETTFDTDRIPEDDEHEPAADLSIVHMSSNVGEFTFNSETLDTDPPQGAYSGSQIWDVSDLMEPEADSTFTYTRDLSVSGSGGSYLGAFFKIPLAVLSVRYPEKEVGTIIITSNPPGAAITLDDEPTQRTTNTTISGIPVGDHQVQVELECYQIPDVKYLEINNGENTTVHFNLRPITGGIEVTSEPSGAWIYLDGGGHDQENMSVQTPATLEDLIIGTYTVEARLDGSNPAFETVTVNEDDTATVNLKFESSSSGSDNSGGSDDGSTPDYGYTGKHFDTYLTDTIHGNISYYEFSNYTGLIHAGESREFPVNIPPLKNGTIRYARLYIYTTWGHDDSLKTGVSARINLKVDGTKFRKDRVYGDRKKEGIYDYLLETFAYNISDLKGGVTGEHTVTVTNKGRKDDVFAAYGVGVVVVVDDPSESEMTYWISEGADAVYANPQFGTTSEDCTTTADFEEAINFPNIKSARLIILSTAGSGGDDDEHRIRFNDGEWFNLLTGGSSAISVAEINVRPYLMQTGNKAEVQSYITSTKGDYMENRGFILAVREDTNASPDGATITNETRGLQQDKSFYSRSSNTRITLNSSDGRINATHITSDNENIELLIPEGTEITNGDGKAVTTFSIKRLRPDEIKGAERAYSIGDSDMKADISMILIVHGEPQEFCEASVFRYNNTLDLWNPIDSEINETSAALTAKIRQGGIYAIQKKESDENTTSNGWIEELYSVAKAFFGFLGIELSDKQSTPSNMSAPNLEDDSPGSFGVSTIINKTAEEEPPVNISSMRFSLSLLSNPPGALIDLDGSYVGKTTPVVLDSLPGGNHTIRMSLDDNSYEIRTIQLERDDELSINLQNASPVFLKKMGSTGPLRGWETNQYGGIYVDSFPGEAEIYVDGRNTRKKTPHLIYGLKKGLHTVKVKKEKFEFHPVKKKVMVNKNAASRVKFSSCSNELEHSITVNSSKYSTCCFSVNGQYLGYRIPKRIDVSTFNSYITICDNGSYISKGISGLTEPNGTVMLRENIPTPCSVLVTTKPAGAEIFVDGFRTGDSTPYQVANLSEGRHLFSVSKPGYIPEEKEILLTDKRQTVQDAEVDLDLETYAFGSLTVKSTPPDAKIYLFNKNTGERTPHTFYYLCVGSYDIKLVGKNGSKKLKDVLVSPYAVSECHTVLAGE